MNAPRIGPGPNARPGRMSRALAFCVSSSVARSSSAAVFTVLELLLSLLAHLGDERKAILRGHLADGIRIDALTRRLHRGRCVLDRLGVLGPGRLLSRRDAELGLQRLDLRRIGEASGRGLRASCRGPSGLDASCRGPSCAHMLHHARAHAIGAFAMHERRSEVARAVTE